MTQSSKLYNFYDLIFSKNCFLIPVFRDFYQLQNWFLQIKEENFMILDYINVNECER